MDWSVFWTDIFLLEAKEKTMSNFRTDRSIEWILLDKADGLIWQRSHGLSSFLYSHWHWTSIGEAKPMAIHVASFWPTGNFNIVQLLVDVRFSSRHDELADFAAQERNWQREPSKLGKQSQRKPFTASTHVPRSRDHPSTCFLFESKGFVPLFKHDPRSQSTISTLQVSPVTPGSQRHLSARHRPKTHVRLVHLP
jgi:hypothetical protein